MLEDTLYLVAAAWIIIDAVIAVAIFWDQRRNGEKGLLWPVAGFLLSLIGLLLYYLLVVRKRPSQGPEYPTKPQYDAPGYKFEGQGTPPPAAQKEEPKPVHQTEGAPRCPQCGTAISTHDLKCPKCGKQLR